MRGPTRTERDLVSIAFELLLTYHGSRKSFKGKSNEEVAAWATKQFNTLGYEGIPMGMNWHYLTKVPD